MSKFVQFTNEYGPIFIIPTQVTGISTGARNKTIISQGEQASIVEENAVTVAKAIDDWFNSPAPILKQPVLKLSQDRLDWLMSLKPGNKVVTDSPSYLKGVCEVVDVSYLSNFDSGVGVRLSKNGKVHDAHIDSAWINPVIDNA